MCSCLQGALGVDRLETKSGAMRLPCGEEQRALQEQEHTAEAHCRCVLKGSWVCGSFFGYGCHLLLFLVMTYVTVAYSMFGHETITLLELLYPLPLDVHPSTPRRHSMLDPSTSDGLTPRPLDVQCSTPRPSTSHGCPVCTAMNLDKSFCMYHCMLITILLSSCSVQ